VSPLSRRKICIGFSPQRVSLLSVRRGLPWGERSPTLDDPHDVACNAAAGECSWHAPLQALQSVLPDLRDSRAEATVVLSNQFMRYSLVPWSENLANAEEELAYSRHCFTRVYGQVADNWVLRLDPGPSGVPRLASAVDADLIDGLRGVFDSEGIPLKSIQPYLMAAFNASRRDMPQSSAWFAVLEPGNLSLGLLDHGHWLQVRSLRIGGVWHAELPLVLEREAYLADTPAVSREVYVCGAGAGETPFPETGDWQFHALRHEHVPSLRAMAG
jgi:hypothetical protein